ncbi:MAG: hypothetical protein M0Z40_15150, partial [Actinomycetota bacterium]|nr:hypothetical protein [Actinomycetota bacterium]
VTDRRAWSWRDLLASFYLHLAHRCAQGRQRPALGGGERPAGLAADQVDLAADTQGRAAVLGLGCLWRTAGAGIGGQGSRRHRVEPAAALAS